MDPALIAGFADGALTRAGVGLWPSPVKAAWPTFGGGFWFAEPGFKRADGSQNVLVPLRHHDGDTTVDGITQTGAEVDPLAIWSLWGRADDDVWAAGATNSQARRRCSTTTASGGQRSTTRRMRGVTVWSRATRSRPGWSPKDPVSFGISAADHAPATTPATLQSGVFRVRNVVLTVSEIR